MRIRTTSLLLLAGLTAAAAVHAGEPAANPDATGHYAGVTVAIDPATGRLRAPTAAEQAALRAKAPRAAASRPGTKARPANHAQAGRTVRRHANGMVTAQASEDMLSNVIATQQADGSIVIQHADHDGNTLDGGAAHE